MRLAALLVTCGCWTASPPPPPAPIEPAPPSKVAPAAETSFDQSTPRRALRSFVRALELERFDVVLRFVPAAYREHMNEDEIREQLAKPSTREMIERLRKNLDAPIDENGDEATMQYADRYEVRFVREEGVWRIKDLD